MPRYNILIACDQKYYDDWAIPCLESIQKYNPWINLHCHIVNPIDLYKVPNVCYTTESKNFVSEAARIAYLQSVRFLLVSRLFENDELVMTIDCDTVCLAAFSEEQFEEIAKEVSIFQHPKSFRWLAGCVTFGTGLFRKDIVKYFYEDDEDFWQIGRDQDILQALNAVYEYHPLAHDWMSIGKAAKDTIFLTLKGEQKVQKNYVETYVRHFKTSIFAQSNKPLQKIYHIHVGGNDLTNPFNYFKQIDHTEYYQLESVKSRFKVVDDNNHVILSGDVNLENVKILAKLEDFTSSTFNTVSIWNGIINPQTKDITEYYSVLDNIDCLSSRDNIKSINWVPCVSCMNKNFDKEKKNNKHSLGAIIDGKNKIKSSKLMPTVPTIFDTDSLKNITTLISCSESIITNSYYGAYWALLFGKRVLITDDIDPRVHLFPLPFFFTSNKYFESIKTFSPAGDFLNLCRSKNSYFYNKIQNIIFPSND